MERFQISAEITKPENIGSTDITTETIVEPISAIPADKMTEEAVIQNDTPEE